jgi:hypothetical protein
MSQNIHLCPTCKLKNKLQLKSQKIIIHIIMSDFKYRCESAITKRESAQNILCRWISRCIYEPVRQI